jgi:Fe-coproporphyrin III synthase
MPRQDVLHTVKRYSTLLTHRVSVLPIAILMPHSACNCRCVMCDIWKGNRNLKQLTHDDVNGILSSLRKLGTRRVVMSGGEALLNPSFFSFCDVLRAEGMRITLLSTGVTVERHAADIANRTDDLILSIDGHEPLHDEIRNIKGAFGAMKRGVAAVKAVKPAFRITGRSVIHRLNYMNWRKIVVAAKELGLQQVSFLAADVTSEAFNRSTPWEEERQQSVLVPASELDALDEEYRRLVTEHEQDFRSGYIAEPALKLSRILQHYRAHHGQAAFPDKKCNAPWVSVVVEADGNVRPCFFHDSLGNIHEQPLDKIINSSKAVSYRRGLNTSSNATCAKCVCYLNLQPRNGNY